MIFLPILFFLSLFFNSTSSFFFLQLLLFNLVFGCAWPLLCTGAFSGCREQGLPSRCGARASHRGGFSRCGAQAPGARVSHRGGFSRCGAQAPGAQSAVVAAWAQLLLLSESRACVR